MNQIVDLLFLIDSSYHVVNPGPISGVWCGFGQVRTFELNTSTNLGVAGFFIVV